MTPERRLSLAIVFIAVTMVDEWLGLHSVDFTHSRTYPKLLLLHVTYGIVRLPLQGVPKNVQPYVSFMLDLDMKNV
jgi:hypothetical protein